MPDAGEIIRSQDEVVVSSRKDDVEVTNFKARTKLDEVVEAGLNIFGGRVLNK